MRNLVVRAIGWCALLCGLWLTGCATVDAPPSEIVPPPPPRMPVEVPPPPVVPPPSLFFPPQQVMESGNYARFLAENRQALARCRQASECEVALFNLGFVHAYTRSPYYNTSKALGYFDELAKKYPATPGAAAGRAWSTLLRDHLALEDKRRRLQTELRTKDSAMQAMKEQLNRSRKLDLQLEQQERELLR